MVVGEISGPMLHNVTYKDKYRFLMCWITYLLSLSSLLMKRIIYLILCINAYKGQFHSNLSENNIIRQIIEK